MKKYIKLGLLIIWMGVIYYLSSQTGSQSKELSDGLLFRIGTFIGVRDIETFVNTNRFIIRKAAHFTEFFILGHLMYLTLREYAPNSNVIIISIILCLFYATSDEIHQLVTSDRSFKILDIVLDTIGASVGIFLTSLIMKYVAKRKST